MGRKKKYKNAAEKQRAWRIRTGKQKRKVPLVLREGEQKGTSEGQIRERHKGETWEEYHLYLTARFAKATGVSREQGKPIDSGKRGVTARRGGGVEPVYPGDYYETQREYEKTLEVKKGRKIKQKGGKKKK